MLDYKAGDWVAWSDFHDGQSDDFRRMAGEGPFLVKSIVSSENVYLIKSQHKIISCYSGKRFRKSVFLNAVKKALAEADRG